MEETYHTRVKAARIRSRQTSRPSTAILSNNGGAFLRPHTATGRFSSGCLASRHGLGHQAHAQRRTDPADGIETRRAVWAKGSV
jgi:hypothetical protein